MLETQKVVLILLILFSIGIPHAGFSDMEQDRLAQIYLKTASLFNNSQNITPTPAEIYPAPISVNRAKCVNLQHQHSYDYYREFSFLPSYLVKIERDPLIGYVNHLFEHYDEVNGLCVYVIGVFENGQYSWSEVEKYTGKVTTHDLRRVRISGSSSLNEIWISHWHSRWPKVEYWHDRYCYYW
jgi:hypothetical protein